MLDQRKIIITCGTGGVGKTTISAALALRAALNGKKALVITIDPAKRLATSLGISDPLQLGDEPQDLTSRLKRLTDTPGELWALMPDTRKTFERFVYHLAPSPTLAEQVIKNPIFQIFAKEFSGTNEYMALQKLHSIASLNRFDLIVLDTPPSRNTLTFLKAPELLTRFFEERIVHILASTKTSNALSFGIKAALDILDKLTGNGFLKNLVEFAQALFQVQAKFTASLKDLTQVMKSQSTSFLIVAAPAPELAAEASHFIQTLKESRFQFDGLILNRTFSSIPLPKGNPDPEYSGLPEFKDGLKILKALQTREEFIEKTLFKEVTIKARLPEMARDVHSLEDLLHVAKKLDQQLSHP